MRVENLGPEGKLLVQMTQKTVTQYASTSRARILGGETLDLARTRASGIRAAFAHRQEPSHALGFLLPIANKLFARGAKWRSPSVFVWRKNPALLATWWLHDNR